MTAVRLDLEKVPMLPNDCYRNCIAVLFKNLAVEGWELVHAVVRGAGPLEGKNIGHAWLEKKMQVELPFDGRPFSLWLVYDPSNDLFTPRDIYYKLADPSYTTRYTSTEMAVQMLRHGHMGPWDPVVERASHKDDDAPGL
jgi:hypothetical protein